MIDRTRMPLLGFGLMRLPQKDGKINTEEVKEMVDSYIKAGFNYFDTAYVYHDGESEKIVKEVLTSRYERSSFYLATKMPGWMLNEKEDLDRIFNEQLERTGAGYFDFYLLHSVEEGLRINNYNKFDAFSWALEKKTEGKIKHFGFSFHGSSDLLIEVLDKHKEIEFVQIQLNYTDWNNQLVQSGKLYEILTERNIPIIVMEPVKGGTLANLPKEAEKILKDENENASSASWALRFVASLDGVMTILSGMSSKEQMEDNINTMKNFKPLSDREKEAIKKVVKILQDKELIGCTSCRYCTAGCPKGISIPDIFRAVNMARLYERDNRPRLFYDSLTSRSSAKASECIECRQCEDACPQHLNITDLLKEAVDKFENQKQA